MLSYMNFNRMVGGILFRTNEHCLLHMAPLITDWSSLKFLYLFPRTLRHYGIY